MSVLRYPLYSITASLSIKIVPAARALARVMSPPGERGRRGVRGGATLGRIFLLQANFGIGLNEGRGAVKALNPYCQQPLALRRTAPPPQSSAPSAGLNTNLNTR